MNRARLLNLIGIAIGVAGLAFVAVKIIRDRKEIADALDSAQFGWLVVAFVSGLAAMTLIGVNWLWIMRAGGAAAPRRRGLAWFFVGQLGKYVPGGIWPIVGQAELAHRGRTPRPLAYSSTAVSMAATFLGAAVVGAVTGLWSLDGDRWIPAVLCIALVIGFATYCVPQVRAAMEAVVTRATKRSTLLPAPIWVAEVVGRHLPVWVLFSGMNIFTVSALGESLDTQLVVRLIAVTCLSWMAGFVIVGLPGGIGVRETVFISLMTASLGGPLAVSVAVVSRIVSVAVDLAGAAISVPVARTGPENSNRYAAP